MKAEIKFNLNEDNYIESDNKFEPCLAEAYREKWDSELIEGSLSFSTEDCFKINGREHHFDVEYKRESYAGQKIGSYIKMQDITEDYTYDTNKIEAFLCPKGVGVELYATTLHYAPCSVGDEGFKVVIVLPKDTNLPLDEKHSGYEDALITAKNKWLIGHAEGGHPAGVHIGLIGPNVSV